MIYLPDLTDGETSDNVPLNLSMHSRSSADEPAVLLSSNTNTLETVSAHSFGSFVRPADNVVVEPAPARAATNGNVNSAAVRRHKSFFEAPKSGSRASPSQGPSFTGMSPAQKMAAAFRRGGNVRRAESFHHSRSLADFDVVGSNGSGLDNGVRLTRHEIIANFEDRSRGKSVERDNGTYTVSKPLNKSLSKSKSMEYLRAKLLSRKLSNANKN